MGAKFTNMRVLNSYWINQDATFKYYEVCVLVGREGGRRQRGIRVEEEEGEARDRCVQLFLRTMCQRFCVQTLGNCRARFCCGRQGMGS